MNTQSITVHLPEGLYSQLKQRAERWNRSVEAEMLDVLSAAMPAEDGLPASVEDELSRLKQADDETLRLAAQSHLPRESAQQLEELHLRRQRQELTEVEAETLAGLVAEYERAMLIRAHAAALWKQRGHDPSELLAVE
jgi:plasmid stability protein